MERLASRRPPRTTTCGPALAGLDADRERCPAEPRREPAARRPAALATSVRRKAALSLSTIDRPAVARGCLLQGVEERLARRCREADVVDGQDLGLEPRVADRDERGIRVELLVARAPAERVVLVRVAREQEAEQPHPVPVALRPEHVPVVRDERRDARVVHQHRLLDEAARVGELGRGQQARAPPASRRRHRSDRLEEAQRAPARPHGSARTPTGRARSPRRRRGTRRRATGPEPRRAAAARRAGRAPPGSASGNSMWIAKRYGWLPQCQRWLTARNAVAARSDSDPQPHRLVPQRAPAERGGQQVGREEQREAREPHGHHLDLVPRVLHRGERPRVSCQEQDVGQRPRGPPARSSRGRSACSGSTRKVAASASAPSATTTANESAGRVATSTTNASTTTAERDEPGAEAAVARTLARVGEDQVRELRGADVHERERVRVEERRQQRAGRRSPGAG